jgi:SAM-dependent methyltransferase
MASLSLRYHQAKMGLDMPWQPNAPQRSDTGSAYAARLAAEKSIYRDCVNVHSLPDIFHYWSNHHVRPQLEAFGLSSPDDMFRKYVGERCERAKNSPARFISIGSGNCDLEIGLAAHLRSTGSADFIIDCLDLNPAMLERGRIAAAEQGLSRYINFVPGDFNEWTPTHEYDAVIANQSLHHVVKLEDLFAKIKTCLKADGSFIVSDLIGRNGHQRWPEALDIIREFWRKLPPSYRFNRALQRYEEIYENWDCSKEGFEGVRSQDILPLLLNHFHFKLFFGFANVIEPFVDRTFGYNFDASAAWDRSFIDDVHQRDEAEILSGRIKPTHMLAVMSRQPVTPVIFRAPLTPQFCLRDPSVRAEAALIPASLDGSRPDAYDWHSWPHSPQREVEIACERLKKAEDEVAKRTAWAMHLDKEFEEKTAWTVALRKEVEEWTARGLRVEKLLEERTAWALQLEKELEIRTASVRQLGAELESVNEQMEARTLWALRLQQEIDARETKALRLNHDLEQLAWARPLDRYFHSPLYLVYRLARWVRNRINRMLSRDTIDTHGRTS